MSLLFILGAIFTPIMICIGVFIGLVCAILIILASIFGEGDILHNPYIYGF